MVFSSGSENVDAAGVASKLGAYKSSGWTPSTT
jgi:hypothetical protein